MRGRFSRAAFLERRAAALSKKLEILDPSTIKRPSQYVAMHDGRVLVNIGQSSVCRRSGLRLALDVHGKFKKNAKLLLQPAI